MENQFHILIKMFPEHKYTDEDIQKRYEIFYSDDSMFAAGWIPYWRDKLSSLSNFVKCKGDQANLFTVLHKQHHSRGTLWGERFKSLIVENGETLINCLAYIDFHPVK